MERGKRAQRWGEGGDVVSCEIEFRQGLEASDLAWDVGQGVSREVEGGEGDEAEEVFGDRGEADPVDVEAGEVGEGADDGGEGAEVFVSREEERGEGGGKGCERVWEVFQGVAGEIERGERGEGGEGGGDACQSVVGEIEGGEGGGELGVGIQRRGEDAELGVRHGERYTPVRLGRGMGDGRRKRDRTPPSSPPPLSLEVQDRPHRRRT